MSTLIKNYFSAANSYRGFISRFESSLFSDDIYKSVIVKGGCGTGKSTLMKRIADYYEGIGDEVERIYCSSDPVSIDGIIIHHGDKKLSIADCTAPHEYDARLPGIKDILINTAEGIRYRDIELRRRDIEAAFREKKDEYKHAYLHLYNAGIQFKKIIEKIKNHYRNTVAEFVNNIVKSINTDNNNERSYLIHSFSRCGLSVIDDLRGGDFDIKLSEVKTFLGMICMKEIIDTLGNKGSPAVFIDPLSVEYPLAIKYHEFTLTPLSIIKALNQQEEWLADEINELITVHSHTLEEARKHFSKAADHHFKLEDYYRESMDFSIQNELFDKSLYFLNN